MFKRSHPETHDLPGQHGRPLSLPLLLDVAMTSVHWNLRSPNANLLSHLYCVPCFREWQLASMRGTCTGLRFPAGDATEIFLKWVTGTCDGQPFTLPQLSCVARTPKISIRCRSVRHVWLLQTSGHHDMPDHAFINNTLSVVSSSDTTVTLDRHHSCSGHLWKCLQVLVNLGQGATLVPMHSCRR